MNVVRMRDGVGEVRAGEVARAAAEAAAAGSSSGEAGEASGRRTDVLVDVFTGADYVVAPPGSTVSADGTLLPLSTRKEFKKAFRADKAIKSAMESARDWAKRSLAVAVTGAGGGCEPSSDESGTARAADIGKKRSQRAAAAGHSHSHSHAHGGQTHSHSHGGHSHAPGESIGHAHIGHTHGAKSGGKGGGNGGKGRQEGHRAQEQQLGQGGRQRSQSRAGAQCQGVGAEAGEGGAEGGEGAGGVVVGHERPRRGWRLGGWVGRVGVS